MRASWYERNGAAADVLVHGERETPEPGVGEVRVRLAVAGVNPADVKRRSGVGGRTMRHALIVPGDDGAGVVDKVGPRVPEHRVGQRVWVHSANHFSPFGTAAQYVVVPATQAVELPDGVPLDVGACLGVPAMTAHRCLFADGPIDGLTVLVTGGAGAVSHYAVEMAKQGGATVIATASTPEKQAAARAAGADHVLDHREPDIAARILDLAPGGAERVVDVAFGANLPLTSRLVAPNGTIASYASDSVPEPVLPFYTLMRKGITIRTVLMFTMPPWALRAATEHVTRLLGAGALTHPIAASFPLDDLAGAHAHVESGQAIGKVIVRIP